MTIAGSRSETRSSAPGHVTPHPSSASRHDFAVFGQQTPEAVDLGGAELHQLLPHAMQRQNRSSLFTATVLTPGC